MKTPPTVVIISGVAGSGKSTVGRKLAAELEWAYFEGDDFHSAANREKMTRGLPLDDDDRAPWLAAIRAAIERCLRDGQPAVFTCSALKKKYRRVLLEKTNGVALVFLSGSLETISARLTGRSGHFMKAGMLRSQFESLEPPDDALMIDAALSPKEIVGAIRRELGP